MGAPLAEALPSPRPHSPHLDTAGPEVFQLPDLGATQH